jgi:membrane associated rhomboid family serine protease
MSVPDRASRSTPVALVLLGGALLGGYGLELWVASQGGAAELESFLHAFGLVPRELRGGRVVTLVTAIFLHAGVFHLLVNGAFLVAFGREVEPRLGAARFAALFLGCGVAAGLLHVAMAPASFVPTVGASGAVSGVLGAWWRVVFSGTAHPPGLGRIPALALLVGWLGAQLAAALLDAGGGQAGWAHVGGFAAGFLAAPLLASRPGRGA